MLHTTLSQAQQAIVLVLRQSLYLPLDDLLFITKQYINPPAVSQAGIARLLKREGISRLTDLIATAEGEKIMQKKTFKVYEHGFIHIDIKYLPQMPDVTSRRYLLVAIYHATRWVFMHIYGDTTDASSVDFLRRLNLASPIKISKILTDNGSQFTNRSLPRTRSLAASMPLTSPAQLYLPSIDWHHSVIRKRMEWSSVSAGVSMNCFSRPVSIAG